ncbi:MAG TPA: hypothetical protein VN704_09645 [Verrucomicrobiae bacterium]|nr:hypothetical protein [Verrucomicrobiae bacterium]
MPYRKVIDELSIYCEHDVCGSCCLKNTDQALPVIIDFRSGIALIFSKRRGPEYRKFLMTFLVSTTLGNLSIKYL